jgi:hypothetical protein
MVQEVHGSTNATLPPISMAQPTQGEGYMIVASDLLQGVEALSSLQNISHRGCALIAAHALECALKAFLWYRGQEKKTLKKVRHDIESLWNMAYKEKTLDIPKVLPTWVKILGSGHGPNFYFRYQEGEKCTVVHGGRTPALIPMAVELRKLVEMVRLAIKG